jgi:hypothetical protein
VWKEKCQSRWTDRRPAIDEQSMKRIPRLHEKPPQARLLMRVTSYPSEHKRIDLRRIPDSCPFAYTELAAPTKHPLTRHNNGRALYCWKQRAQGDETCKSAGHRRSLFLPPRPWVGSPFDIHASAGRRFLGPQWSLDPSRRFESSVTRKQVQVRAALRRIGDIPEKPSFPKHLPGPVRASGRIVARRDRSGHSMDEHSCKI